MVPEGVAPGLENRAPSLTEMGCTGGRKSCSSRREFREFPGCPTTTAGIGLQARRGGRPTPPARLLAGRDPRSGMRERAPVKDGASPVRRSLIVAEDFDLPAAVDRFEQWASVMFFGGECMPALMPNYGPDQWAGFLGAGLALVPDMDTSWAKPLVPRACDKMGTARTRAGVILTLLRTGPRSQSPFFHKLKARITRRLWPSIPRTVGGRRLSS